MTATECTILITVGATQTQAPAIIGYDPKPMSERHIGLGGATAIGVSAIVGAGILVLAGPAFVRSGPSAVVAFALNGLVAFITAASFAELSSAFPESGGPYTFAKKVLSVRAAFAVGWIVWFAYIVAGVLYALGFAAYTVGAIQHLWRVCGGTPPAWLSSRRLLLFLGTAATAAYALSLMRKASGGGQMANIGKVAAFAILILVGVVAVFRQPLAQTGDALTPFFSGGISGLLVATGFTFIALQGFDLIAAVGGEIKDPGRTIPRAMFFSLGIAMAIYIPLLLLVSTVGTDAGEPVTAMAARHPDTAIAVAAQHYMGPIGYWLVVVAAILSTLSALGAIILAASHVALSMAKDNTLPPVLAKLHPSRDTPAMAIFATVLTLMAVLFMVPNLATAGAAASLIFFAAFALTHVMTYLARVRGGGQKSGFQTPWFPLVPAGGAIVCMALAVFQAIATPDAGGIVVIWLGLGVILYFSIFASRAETRDAWAEAADPSLVRLRGQSPLVLLPVANPAHAASMVAVANALAARDVGRVLLLSIVQVTDDASVSRIGAAATARLIHAQEVVKHALTASYVTGHAPEALITQASEPWAEIRRVAEEHGCESMLFGVGDLSQTPELPIADLINELSCDVAIMRAPTEWRLEKVRRVLCPVGGRGEQHELRARLLGTLSRICAPEVIFIRGLEEDATDSEVRAARREVEGLLASDTGRAKVVIERAQDPAAAILEAAVDCDLVLLGLSRVGRRRAALSPFSRRIAAEAACATIMLSSGR